MQANPIWPVNSDFPVLENDIRCDILIVGAGISGISSAYHLMKKGYDVVVIEEDEIASAATGASSGILYFGTGLGITSSIESFGFNNAKNLWNETKESIGCIKSIIFKNSIDCGFRDPGVISMAKTDEESKQLEIDAENLKKIGFTQKIIDSSEINNYFKARRFLTGLKEPCAQIRPGRFVYGLAKSENIKLFQNTPMLGYTESDSIIVSTPKAKISCNKLLIATNIKPIFGLENHCYIENTTIVASHKLHEKIKQLWNQDIILWTLGEDYDILYTQEGRAMLDVFSPKGVDEKINFYFGAVKATKEFVYGDSWFQTKDYIPIVGNTKNLQNGSENIFVSIAMGEQGIVAGFTSGRKIPKLLEGKRDIFLEMSSPNRFQNP